MGCRLLTTQPLSEPMLMMINWKHGNKVQRNFNKKPNNFQTSKLHFKMLPGNRQPFCFDLNVLISWCRDKMGDILQNGCHIAEGVFRCIYFSEKFCIKIQISLYFVPQGSNQHYTTIVPNNGLASNSERPFSESMLVYFADAYMPRLFQCLAQCLDVWNQMEPTVLLAYDQGMGI